MAIGLITKKGDTRDWSFTLSDADGDALSLEGARVKFRMRRHEWHTSDLFVRDTGGTGSDLISVPAPASDGTVLITPATADWAGLSDATGVFVGEFQVTDSNDDVIYLDDVSIRVDEVLY